MMYRPTIIVLNRTPTHIPQDVVYIYELRVTGVCHPMIADKDDVDDVEQISHLEGGMKILGELVNFGKGFLLASIREYQALRGELNYGR
jgi:hypothetical protein